VTVVGHASAVVARTPPSALVILGQPVAHSLSPVFQSAALQHLKLDVPYDRQHVSLEELDAALELCRAANCGGNVTMPHKRAVFERAVHCTPVAARTGAVNTFWWEDGHLIGHNTDVDGIAATVGALCPDEIAGDVVVLGAGGSAAAVLVALESARRQPNHGTVVLARSPERAEALLHQVRVDARVVSDVAQLDWSRVALVINATPAGMHPTDSPPMDITPLAPQTAVFDLVYQREGTRWVNAAKARGLTAEDGLRMLVEQGASAFEAWFAVEAPRAAMWSALGVPMPSADMARR